MKLEKVQKVVENNKVIMNSRKEMFRLPESVAYLNCAYMSPLLKKVEAVGQEMVSLKCRPFDILPVDFFQPVADLKASFAKLVGAAEPGRVAIIPSASYGISTVAANISLSTGAEVLMVEEQFPSNYYAWERLTRGSGASIRVIKAPGSPNRSPEWNYSILEAITSRTEVVAISNVHWADGTVFDLAAIREKTNQVGALLIIDGTQSVGALPIDVETLKPDALICAGYKWLLGPYAIGLAYFGSRFDGGKPIEENWINRKNSEDFQNLVRYQPDYKPLAGRYSVGEQSNFILVPMMNAALEQLLGWGAANIQAYCKKISSGTIARLREMNVMLEDDKHRCGHLFGLRVDDRHFDAQRLSAAFKKRRVYVSFRGNAIRVSPHLYNEKQDFIKLLDCFEEARRKAGF